MEKRRADAVITRAQAQRRELEALAVRARLDAQARAWQRLGGRRD